MWVAFAAGISRGNAARTCALSSDQPHVGWSLDRDATNGLNADRCPKLRSCANSSATSSWSATMAVPGTRAAPPLPPPRLNVLSSRPPVRCTLTRATASSHHDADRPRARRCEFSALPSAHDEMHSEVGIIITGRSWSDTLRFCAATTPRQPSGVTCTSSLACTWPPPRCTHSRTSANATSRSALATSLLCLRGASCSRPVRQQRQTCAVAGSTVAAACTRSAQTLTGLAHTRAAPLVAERRLLGAGSGMAASGPVRLQRRGRERRERDRSQREPDSERARPSWRRSRLQHSLLLPACPERSPAPPPCPPSWRVPSRLSRC